MIGPSIFDILHNQSKTSRERDLSTRLLVGILSHTFVMLKKQDALNSIESCLREIITYPYVKLVHIWGHRSRTIETKIILIGHKVLIWQSNEWIIWDAILGPDHLHTLIMNNIKMN